MNSDASNLDIYYNLCNDKLNSKEKHQMMPICKKYLRFLDFSEVWGSISTKYDVSLLLNYWLSDKIAPIHGFTNIDKIRIDFAALQMVWYYFKENRIRKSYYDKFKPDTKIFDEEDWEKRKELYENYVNYDTLFKTAELFPEKCEEYYEKIKEMISVYKFFEDKCSSKAYKCPDVFDKCKDKNIESSLEDLSCHAIIKARSASILEGESTDQPRDVEQRPLGPADGPQLQLDQADSYTQELTETSGFRKKVTHSVLGAAPVLLTATMLYRYTPLGPWIRGLRGGRTNSINAMDTFSHYTQETGDMFSDEPASYISYQPM
ncbi:hypothetical protein PVBG_05841 [Plasmodium vivax Brazil I]|uniref:VIR protein n=1 Tax=Plasmodium vivax (strain Brazil I) TaxID=1033975 RepID=A0A0J9T2U3_PLAV1|nr:hypothetical protein PVBG_05841 [Plasmodium vivax Brazil I]